MRFRENPNTPIIENAIAENSGGIGTKENPYGQKISLLDVLDLSLNKKRTKKERLEEYEKFLTQVKILYGVIFGSINTKKSREVFTKSFRDGFEYWKNSVLPWDVDSGVLAKISQILTTIDPLSKREIESIISGRGFSEEELRHLLAILKATFIAKHAKSEKSIFPQNLTRKATSFDEKIQSSFEKRTKDSDFPLAFEFGDRKIKIKPFSLNAKADNRIFDKLGRRPTLEIETLNDILRARFVVEESDDVEKLKDHLVGNLSGFSLVIKTAKSNTSAGERGGEIVLLGKVDGTPCEIKIMTLNDYEQSETGVNHHQVYAFLQDCQLYERYYGAIPNKFIQEGITKLSGDGSIWKNLKTDVVKLWCEEYNVSLSNLKGNQMDVNKGKAQEFIRARFDKMFFSTKTANLDNAAIIGDDNSRKIYCSYENMFRCGLLRKDQGYNEVYHTMFLKIKELIKAKTSIDVSELAVKELFNESQEDVPVEIFDVIKLLKGLPQQLIKNISSRVSDTIT